MTEPIDQAVPVAPPEPPYGVPLEVPEAPSAVRPSRSSPARQEGSSVPAGCSRRRSGKCSGNCSWAWSFFRCSSGW